MNETVVTMCGNLASDVRSTTTPGGLAFATFRMGSSSRRFDQEPGVGGRRSDLRQRQLLARAC